MKKDYQKRMEELITIASVDQTIWDIVEKIKRSTLEDERNELIKWGLILIKNMEMNINSYYIEEGRYGWEINYFTGIRRKINKLNNYDINIYKKK